MSSSGNYVNGPNASKEYKETEHGTKGDAQAEVFSLSASDGKLKAGAGALQAGAGFEATDDGFKAGAQAEALHSSISYGPFGVEGGALKAGAGIKAGYDGVGAKIDAKLAEISGSAGPIKATLGVSADTGIGVDKNGLDVKFLGTGIKIGREIGFSVGGSGISFKLW